MTDDDVRLARYQEALLYAHGQLAQGRPAEAKRLLLALEAVSEQVADADARFLLYRLLGQVARTEGRPAEALAYYEKCLDAAATEATRSGALEGLALTAVASGDLGRAVGWFEEAADAARNAGDAMGYAMVLQNHATALIRHSRDGAEELLRAALEVEGLTDVQRGIVTDNLARELERQGHFDEAVRHTEEAARLLAAAGAEHDAYKAWLNLADLHRAAGDEAAAGVAFTHAHDLGVRLHARIDEEHYGPGYDERVRAIEARTAQMLRERYAGEPGVGDAEIALDIGLHATAGGDLADQAERRFEAGDLAGAEELLHRAETHWAHLQALHLMPRVWNLRGVIRLYAGDHDRGHEVLMRSREVTQGLGDAFRESIALRHLAICAQRLGIGEEDELALLLRARALSRFSLRRRLGAAAASLPEEAPGDDFGVHDGRLAQICLGYGAHELARTYSELSIAAAGADDGPSAYRLAARLTVRLHLAERTGRDAEAAETVERLTALAARHPAPQTVMVASLAVGAYRFRRGERSPELLDRLTEACDAHEEVRRHALDLGPLPDFHTLTTPPYREAVEVALAVGQVGQAFTLAERARSRSLLDAVRHGLMDAPAPAASTDPGAASTDPGAAVTDPAATDPAATAPASAGPASAGPASTGHSSTDHVADDPLAREQELWLRQRRLREELSLWRQGERPDERIRRLYAVEDELGAVRAELAALWDRLADTRPEVRRHRMAEPITAREAARLLARAGATALVELWSGDEALHAFVIVPGRTEPELVTVGRHDTLGLRDGAGRMRALRTARNRRDRQRALGSLLVGPLHAALRSVVDGAAPAGDPAGSVLVVPHGPLHGVPMHLSPDPAVARGRPPLRYLPSASLLRSSGAWHRDGTVVVGGFPGAGRADGSAELAFCRSECAEVAHRLGGTARVGHTVTGEWLQEAVTAAERLSLVHLACHATFDERHPERSGLLLARGTGSGGEVVTVDQLAALDWSGALVTLSACGSGRHRVRRGDELTGLGHALLSAGARGLIVSQWPVLDHETAVLMSLFYEDLAARPGWNAGVVADALARAQRRMAAMTAADLVDWACSRLETPRRPAAADELSGEMLRLAHRLAGTPDADVPPTDADAPPTDADAPPTAVDAGPPDADVPPVDADLMPTAAYLPPAHGSAVQAGAPPLDTDRHRRLAAAGGGYRFPVFADAAGWGAFVFYGA
ncbi:CHAT domain-containing protein [Streptomyces sp. NPDC028635]|uniref:CHAT domain-containing protein n=1 Tax=Streptomyces sp. NPDC028635 TaxID=3154800 RepID=UPI0033EEA79E